jgi:hypothetical protein
MIEGWRGLAQPWWPLIQINNRGKSKIYRDGAKDRQRCSVSPAGRYLNDKKWRRSMNASLRGITVALVLTGSTGLAAGATLTLTTAQQQKIYRSVASEKGQYAPVTFQARIGEKAPPSLTMHQLPMSATGQVSAAKGLDYAKLANKEVLLISPKDRQVEDIIMPPGTTGSAKK